MARYGDLDSVKLKVQRYLIPNTDIDGTVTCADAERWFLKLLDEEPTADVVEVVHCKDCEYHHWEQEPCHGKTIHICSVLHAEVFGDFYCYYGKAKAKGE